MKNNKNYKQNHKIEDVKEVIEVEVIEPTVAIYQGKEFKIVDTYADEILLESLDNKNHFVQWYKINAVRIRK